MTQKATIWMPLYIGDYLADTPRLTTEQHGAYLLLIMDYWRNGPLPAQDAILQQITRLDRSGWKRNGETLLAYFTKRDGKLYHKRIEAELERAKANSATAERKARNAASARWKKKRDGQGDA